MNLKPFTHVSVSQVETYSLCARKWWLNKIAGQNVPQHPSASLGSQVHASCESFVKGEGTDIHRLAHHHRGLLEELRDDPGTAVEVSFEELLPRPISIKLVGKIDILNLRREPPLVLDWKTLSDQKWAKTEEELASNPQLLTYAKHVTDVLPDARMVRVGHATIPTKVGIGRGTYRTTDVTREAVLAYRHDTFLPIVGQMKETALLEAPADVPPTLSACSAFGGCPFRGMCDALDTRRASPYAALDTDKVSVPDPSTGDSTVPYDFLIRLYRSPENIPVDQLAKCNDAPYAALLAVYKDAGSIPPAVLAKCKDAPSASASATPATKPAPAPASAPVVASITPPEVVPDPAPAIVKPDVRDDESTANIITTLGWSDELFNAMPNDVLEVIIEHGWRPENIEYDVTPNEESPVGYDILNPRLKAKPPASEPPPAPRRRGRPPGSKNAVKAPTEPVVVEEVKDTVVETKDIVVTEVVQTEPVNTEIITDVLGAEMHDVSQGFTLYINCYPEVGLHDVVYLDAWLAPIMRLVAENNVDEKTGRKAPVPHYSVIPYGKGTSAVVAHVTGNVPMLNGKSVVVDTRSPAASAVLEYLRPLASGIVVGRMS